MKNFSPEVKKALKSYVYVLSDPDTRIPFYVGKGTNDRIFDHSKEEGESAKISKLKEIEERGKEPITEILAHGMDSETAEWVEMAAIDLIGKENLTNAVRGKHALTCGRETAEMLELRFCAQKLEAKDFSENVALLKLSKIYQPGMEGHLLYEAARGYWYNVEKKVQGVAYALPVFNGIVLEVYEIAQWFKAGATSRALSLHDDHMERRCEFVGKIAAPSIREKYYHKSVAAIDPKHWIDNVIIIKGGKMI